MPACVKTLHHISRNKITQSDLEMHSFVQKYIALYLLTDVRSNALIVVL